MAERILVPALAYRDVQHLRLMARFPRLCLVLSAAVNHDLAEVGMELAQWCGEPCLDVQGGPMVIGAWRMGRDPRVGNFLRETWKHRHAIKRILCNHTAFTWAYALHWTLVARRAFSPLEEVILQNPPKPSASAGMGMAMPPAAKLN